jgi:serine/threonine-protein kinase
MSSQPSNSGSTGPLASAESTLGRIVVDMGLATPEEIIEVEKLADQLGKADESAGLGDLLVSNEVLTQRQLNRALRRIEAERSTQQIPGYQLLEKLGSGAMATVFKGRQLSLDRIVAIKVLPKKFMSDPEFVERFYAEGRAAAKLNHPHIVGAIDVGKAGDFHYFVMEYVEGHTVFDYLRKHGHYNEADALDVILPIAEALEHVHEQELMHRDVKPKNIMITKAGIPKLADMGLARKVQDEAAAQAEAGRAYGTPYYISPEQIRGRLDIDFRADIYGLGATFYHMVTGKVPFDGPNPSAVMHKHLKQPLTPPDHLNEELSAGVSEIIEVMMAKDRDRRYASTSDLLEDLRSVKSGEPPLQARRKFELADLASLEPGENDEQASQSPTPSIMEQPVFWVAMGSILLNVVLLVFLVLLLIAQQS